MQQAVRRVSSPCFESKNAMKNDRTLAEVILEQPLFLAFGDKLILRSGDAKVLIGGGEGTRNSFTKTL